VCVCFLIAELAFVFAQSLATRHLNTLNLDDSMIKCLETLTVNQLIKKFPSFMEPKVFHCAHAVGPHLKPFQPRPPLLTVPFNIILPSTYRSAKYSFSLSFRLELYVNCSLSWIYLVIQIMKHLVVEVFPSLYLAYCLGPGVFFSIFFQT
jgi:hypothetical protein